jgi:hypothetical protein
MNYFQTYHAVNQPLCSYFIALVNSDDFNIFTFGQYSKLKALNLSMITFRFCKLMRDGDDWIVGLPV